MWQPARAVAVTAALALALAAAGGCAPRSRMVTRDDGPPPRALEYAARAELHAARGAHERAWHEFEAAVASAPWDVWLRVRVAEEMAASGQLRAGLDRLAALIAAVPRDPVPRIARARLLVIKRPRTAADDLEAALALSPDPATRRDATILYGAAAARAGRAAAGVGRLTVLAAALPHDLDLTIALAEAQAAAGDVAASFATLAHALAGRDPRRPGSADLLIAWAQLSLRRGDRAAAIAHAQRAHAGDANHLGALVFLVEIALEDGRADDAASLLARAQLLGPRDPRVLYAAARASSEPIESERLLLQALGAGPAIDLQEQIERRLGPAPAAAAAASPAH